MCFSKTPKVTASPIQVPIDSQATRAASYEMALRRRRQGAAADIFTSPTGIPAAATMGGAN